MYIVQLITIAASTASLLSRNTVPQEAANFLARSKSFVGLYHGQSANVSDTFFGIVWDLPTISKASIDSASAGLLPLLAPNVQTSSITVGSFQPRTDPTIPFDAPVTEFSTLHIRPGYTTADMNEAIDYLTELAVGSGLPGAQYFPPVYGEITPGTAYFLLGWESVATHLATVESGVMNPALGGFIEVIDGTPLIYINFTKVL